MCNELKEKKRNSKVATSEMTKNEHVMERRKMNDEEEARKLWNTNYKKDDSKSNRNIGQDDIQICNGTEMEHTK